MITAMVPLDIVEASPEKNLEAVKEYCRHIREGVAVMVLPELFSTGFIKDEATFQLLAEPLDGETMKCLQDISSKKSIAIAGSFLCRDEEDGTLRNRSFFINPDDDCRISYYDKRHLFTLSPEYRLFKGGERQSPIICYREWNIALSVCFDLRFPVWNRNTDNRYDMMIVPANWPDSRFLAWKHLLMARAIENMAVYVGANRSGSDQYGTYSYLSTIAINERGTIVSEFHGNTPIRYATFNLKELRDFREKFPVYKLADKFSFDSEKLQ